jgi:hypothetical protein
VRWWLNTDHGRFCVDNAVVNGMDFSALSPDIWMVQWTDGKGEIERQDEFGNNLNGLRESFIDITPYCPLFQQFLSLVQGLNLAQAKKVQTDLIVGLFDSKRQAPLYYPVAAGNYSWDATDATIYSSLVPALQNAIASINAVIAQLNAAIPALSANDISLRDQDNNNIVGPGNALITDINNHIATPGFQLVDFINSTLLGDRATALSTVNYALQNDGSGIFRGLLVDIAHTTVNFSGVGGVPFNIIDLSPVDWPALSPVSGATTSWIPIGSSVPVDVTPDEAAAILQAIAARTNNLAAKRSTRIAQVNAKTAIPDVIAYDVTAGW